MNPLFTAAKEIQDFMSGKGWKFCIIGGLALQRWGEPRQTNDVENIKIRQGPKLNWKLILKEIKPLAEAKEAPEIVNKLVKMASK